jgi:hypothetical protein
MSRKKVGVVLQQSAATLNRKKDKEMLIDLSLIGGATLVDALMKASFVQ